MQKCRTMEESLAEPHDSQDTGDLSVSETNRRNAPSIALVSPPVATCHTQSSSAELEFSLRAPLRRERWRGEATSSSRSHEGQQDHRRSKELSSTHYLRALLLCQQQQRGASAPAEEAAAEMDVARSRGSSKNCSEAAVAAMRTNALPSANPKNTLPWTAGPTAAVSVASLPCVAASHTTCHPEEARRRALFEIERLMLEVRPYDSIEFFHVQRELVKFLGLGPQRRASLTSTLPWQRSATTATRAGTAEEGATNNPSTTTSSNAGGFWKRLCSRWRRDGTGTSRDFKGDGDVNNLEYEVQKQNHVVPDSPISAYTVSLSHSSPKRDAKETP